MDLNLLERLKKKKHITGLNGLVDTVGMILHAMDDASLTKLASELEPECIDAFERLVSMYNSEWFEQLVEEIKDGAP